MTIIPHSNYTMVPNVILDVIMQDLNLSELKVLLAVVRKTIGYHMETKALSNKDLQNLTGISRNAVRSAVASLIENNLIKTIGKGARGATKYTLNLTDQEGAEFDPLESEGSEIDPPKGSESDPLCDEKGSESDPHINKDIKDKDKETLSPDGEGSKKPDSHQDICKIIALKSWGVDWDSKDLTKNLRGQITKAAKKLREMNATVSEIEAFYQWYATETQGIHAPKSGEKLTEWLLKYRNRDNLPNRVEGTVRARRRIRSTDPEYAPVKPKISHAKLRQMIGAPPR